MYQGEMPQIATLGTENHDGCVKVALLKEIGCVHSGRSRSESNEERLAMRVKWRRRSDSNRCIEVLQTDLELAL